MRELVEKPLVMSSFEATMEPSGAKRYRNVSSVVTAFISIFTSWPARPANV